MLGEPVSAGAGAAPPPPESPEFEPPPPDESCPWWLLPPLAAALVVVVVVVVVVVGAGVPWEPHATDSTPTATAVTPTVREARLRMWAMVNDNGVSLSSKVTT